MLERTSGLGHHGATGDLSSRYSSRSVSCRKSISLNRSENNFDPTSACRHTRLCLVFRRWPPASGPRMLVDHS